MKSTLFEKLNILFNNFFILLAIPQLCGLCFLLFGFSFELYSHPTEPALYITSFWCWGGLMTLLYFIRTSILARKSHQYHQLTMWNISCLSAFPITFVLTTFPLALALRIVH